MREAPARHVIERAAVHWQYWRQLFDSVARGGGEVVGRLGPGLAHLDLFSWLYQTCTRYVYILRL